ncbi:MAG: hypothetical protein UY44_C0001G0073 [Candidatus Kaiserbacteria bacterium GW2011_GWA2_49_19]|uniref:Nuclear protein SET n=1 Tax=Candidatus Kaiserbacteria bacterium GW2011_GWA2_49_19 TaxID=1618669 RepID=A0A0G1VSL1_9BACT|nr:MAG: hypothetical protein UY44_C0001G0073 [Candidatus Kaiserbacteria bacterium GW2011_GWA2_49_19]
MCVHAGAVRSIRNVTEFDFYQGRSLTMCNTGCCTDEKNRMRHLEVRKSLTQGKGVFTLRDFKKDEIVYTVSRGKFVKKNEVKNLSEYEQEHLDRVDLDTYELMQEPACFVNHSCEPNVIEELLQDRILGRAYRDINKGEEIGVDYRIRAFDDWKMECKCGSKTCSGMVEGNFFSLPPDLQKKYLPFAPKFIQDEYAGRTQKSEV